MYNFKLFKPILFIALFISLFIFSSCSDSSAKGDESTSDVDTTLPDTQEVTSAEVTTSPEETTKEPEPSVPQIVIAEKGQKSDFSIVLPSASIGTPEIRTLMTVYDTIKSKLGVALSPKYDNAEESDNEILIGCALRKECADIMNEISDDEYVISVLPDDGSGKTKIVIAYNNFVTGYKALNYFIDEFIKKDKVAIPEGFYVKMTYKNPIITSSIENLRDPCILVENGTYYVYGTGWNCYKNTSGSLEGDWKYLGVIAETPTTSIGDHWAPEVHKYNGAYYMFTTYRSSENNRHGCTILKSDSPEGPFVEITNGTITPSDWDAIDGTLYIDPDGQPWLVFVHEWVSTDDGVGRMAAAKLSDDFTKLISEPIELFSAADAPWCNSPVTDGCWMYQCEDGQLLMIWSSWDKDGYAVGISRSVSGKIDGEWTHDDALLYSKSLSGTYEGGHGMLFTDTNGQMYLSIHSPNSAQGSRKEAPTFVAVKEENSTLVWDTDND